MTLDEIIARTWDLIEEAQRDANDATSPAAQRQCIRRRDALTEIRLKLRAWQKIEETRPAHGTR